MQCNATKPPVMKIIIFSFSLNGFREVLIILEDVLFGAVVELHCISWSVENVESHLAHCHTGLK